MYIPILVSFITILKMENANGHTNDNLFIATSYIAILYMPTIA